MLLRVVPAAQLCWAKSIFLSQTDTGWISFIHFYCAGSHTQHHWRCSKYTTQIKAGFYAYTIKNRLVILEASVVFMSVWLQRQEDLWWETVNTQSMHKQELHLEYNKRIRTDFVFRKEGTPEANILGATNLFESKNMSQWVEPKLRTILMKQ